MLPNLLPVLSFLFLFTSAQRAGAQANDRVSDGSASGRIGCPQCKNDGSEVARLLQSADALYDRFKPREALKELQNALQMDPQNHEALAKLARVYIEFGDRIAESGPDWREKRLQQYLVAEQYARRAVKADPSSTWGHFYVAASLGKIALQSSVARQLDLAQEIRDAVEKAIALDPENGFAYHIYGVWHRNMAEVGQLSRVFASVVLWRSVPRGALEKSVEYLKRAISLNPTVIMHRLELGKTYLAMGKWDFARDALRSIQDLPKQFSDDHINKRTAQKLLQEIRDR